MVVEVPRVAEPLPCSCELRDQDSLVPQLPSARVALPSAFDSRSAPSNQLTLI